MWAHCLLKISLLVPMPLNLISDAIHELAGLFIWVINEVAKWDCRGKPEVFCSLPPHKSPPCAEMAAATCQFLSSHSSQCIWMTFMIKVSWAATSNILYTSRSNSSTALAFVFSLTSFITKKHAGAPGRRGLFPLEAPTADFPFSCYLLGAEQLAFGLSSPPDRWPAGSAHNICLLPGDKSGGHMPDSFPVAHHLHIHAAEPRLAFPHPPVTHRPLLHT